MIKEWPKLTGNRDLTKLAAIKIIKSLHDFILGIHYEGTIALNGLIQRLTSSTKNLLSLIACN